MNRSSRKESSVYIRALCVSIVILTFSPAVFSQKRDSIYDPDKTIIYKNGKFKVYNNWISGGAGEAYNFTHYGKQFTLGLDYNFHIKQEYLQLGLFFMGDRFGSYNDYNYHLAYGRRIENNSINFAWFAGLAYSTGYKKINGLFSR